MAERICLNAIDEKLMAHGYSCSAIGLPTPVALPPELTPASDGDTNDGNQQEFAAIGERNMELLNDEQRRAATAILDAMGNANSTASAGRRGNASTSTVQEVQVGYSDRKTLNRSVVFSLKIHPCLQEDSYDFSST